MAAQFEEIAFNIAVERAKLIAAVKRFQNADTEFNRATSSGEQPRLNRAGTRYAVAKIKLFKLIS